MDNFTYYAPTLFEFGRGSEEKTGMLTFLTGARRVMLVYGQKYVKTNGLLDRLRGASLTRRGLKEALGDTDAGRVIHGLTNEQLIELIINS